ncbi:hypothetical protein [Streptomyces sp. NPDC003697]
MSHNVFSREVQRRTSEGMSYDQMEAMTRKIGGKEGTLTAAWWNKVALGESAPPPEPKCIPGVAGVLEVHDRNVALLICQQWYEVSPEDFIRELLERAVDKAGSWLRSSLSSLLERHR